MQFIDLLRELNIPFKQAGESHHVREGWIGLPCPHCGSQEWHLGYNLSSGAINCWKCGRHSVRDTLIRLAPHSYDQIRLWLDNRPIRKVDSEEQRIRCAGKYKVPSAVTDMLKPHREYLKQRNLDPKEMIRLWNLQGIGENFGMLSWRIFIPIYLHDRPVSWTARAIGDKVTQRNRYRSAPPECEAIHRSDLLFGLDYVRHAAIIVEGPFDVMRIGPGAIASLGASYSTRQMIQMSKIPVRVICFDRGANIAANKLANDLSPMPGETFVVELDSKDPGSATDKEIRKLRSKFLEG